MTIEWQMQANRAKTVNEMRIEGMAGCNEWAQTSNTPKWMMNSEINQNLFHLKAFLHFFINESKYFRFILIKFPSSFRRWMQEQFDNE